MCSFDWNLTVCNTVFSFYKIFNFRSIDWICKWRLIEWNKMKYFDWADKFPPLVMLVRTIRFIWKPRSNGESIIYEVNAIEWRIFRIFLYFKNFIHLIHISTLITIPILLCWQRLIWLLVMKSSQKWKHRNEKFEPKKRAKKKRSTLTVHLNGFHVLVTTC